MGTAPSPTQPCPPPPPPGVPIGTLEALEAGPLVYFLTREVTDLLPTNDVAFACTSVGLGHALL